MTDLVFGRNEKGHEVVMHLRYPRLIARVVMVDATRKPLHPDEDADVVRGFQYQIDDVLLCELDGFDVGVLSAQGAGAALKAMAEFAHMHMMSGVQDE